MSEEYLLEADNEKVRAITRIDVINPYERVMSIGYNMKIDKLALQDDGRTLKIFVSSREVANEVE